MQKVYLIVLILLSSPFLQASYLDQEGVVIISVPVADCLGVHSSEIDQNIDSEELYSTLAFSPETGPHSCPRVHQCLYNEMGILRETKGNELLVEFPHFFCIGTDGKSHSRFWVHKNSVYQLSHKYLNSEILFSSIVPEPFTPANCLQIAGKDILTLTLPWQDTETGTFYSVGSRFKRYPEQDREHSWAVFLINYHENSVRIVHIPHEQALVVHPRTLTESKKLFIELLRRWIADKEGVIPYVWGGCSYIDKYDADKFSCCQGERGASQFSNWQRPALSEAHEKAPHTGFDCSGLILRAAQIAGIRYFCKNTTTIGLSLKDVEAGLEAGDLILYKGHVAVVGDLEKETLIDSYGYSKGYGCLREVPLAEAFGEVATYKDLSKIHQDGKPLGLKNRAGIAVTTVPSVRLLKLAHQVNS